MFTVIPSLVSHSGLVHQLLRLLSTLRQKSSTKTLREVCKSAKGAGLGQLQAKIMACRGMSCSCQFSKGGSQVSKTYQGAENLLSVIWAIYQFVFEHNSQADLVSSSFNGNILPFYKSFGFLAPYSSGKNLHFFPCHISDACELFVFDGGGCAESHRQYREYNTLRATRLRKKAPDAVLVPLPVPAAHGAPPENLCLGVECLPCAWRF